MVEFWTKGEPITADKTNDNLYVVDELAATVSHLKSLAERISSGEPLTWYARLTSEDAGTYGWVRILRNGTDTGWSDSNDQVSSTTFGTARHVMDLEGLPVDAANNGESTKVVMWFTVDSNGALKRQFEVLAERDGGRVALGHASVGGTTTPLTANAIDWDIETQEDDDVEGGLLTYLANVHHQYATSTSDGAIKAEFRRQEWDLGGRTMNDAPLAVCTLATVRMCPPISEATADAMIYAWGN